VMKQLDLEKARLMLKLDKANRLPAETRERLLKFVKRDDLRKRFIKLKRISLGMVEDEAITQAMEEDDSVVYGSYDWLLKEEVANDNAH